MPKKKANGLPTVDVRITPSDHKFQGLFVNQRVVVAHIGQLAMELFRQEMIAVVPDLTGKTNPDGSQLHGRTDIRGSVVRACDGAEQIFAELHRRGWLVLTPQTEELLQQDEKLFGIHRDHD